MAADGGQTDERLPEFHAGDVFDGVYEIQICIGNDRLIHRYHAREQGTLREVEIFVLADPTPELRIAWSQRSRELSLVRHPGIRELLNLGGIGQHPYMVVPHVPGPTLRDVRATGPLPYPRVHAIAGQLIEVLATLHRHGLRHGQLRLSSCVCTETPGDVDAIVVCDLGTHVQASGSAQDDIVALARLLAELVDEQQAPVGFRRALEDAHGSTLEQFAQALDSLVAPRATGIRRLALVSAAVGLVATTVGIGWWIAQR